jgi:cell division protein FtsL
MAVAVKLPALLAPREDRDNRPKLVLVPQSERRYLRVFSVMALIVAVMFCIVALRAHMAQQEMRLDKLNYDITRARAHFETLRAERANLQSPGQLMNQASLMGLVPSLGIRMVGIPAAVAAEVAATVGKVDSDVVAHTESPLDEFGRMKAVVVGTP